MRPNDELASPKQQSFYSILDQWIAIKNQEDGFLTTQGERRFDLDSSEFTLIFCSEMKVSFSHKVTENRVYLIRATNDDSDWRLFVPQTDYSLNRGHFDRSKV